DQAYLFVTALMANPGSRPQTAALRLSDQSLQILSDPLFNSQGFNAWINDGTGKLTTALGFMAEKGELYALNPQTGQPDLLASIAKHGTICRSESLLNVPGEPAAQRQLEYAGADNACSHYNDNVAFAFSSDPGHQQALPIGKELVVDAVTLTDDRFQRVGFVGLKNQKLVVWDNNFNIVNELADSPYGEVVNVTAPGS